MNEEKKETKTTNSIGMFDFCKGILMLAIIIGHSVTDYFHYWGYDVHSDILTIFLGGFIRMLMYGFIPMFFMICGYGFRKMTIGKTIKKQFKYFWKPYVMIVLITAIIVIAKKIVISGDIMEGLKYQVLPYFLAFCPGEKEFLGIYMDSIGPIWFFWVFVLGCILLDVILQEEQFWVQCILVGMLACIGMNARDMILPFCAQQALICCGYMFVGWLMKKHAFLERRFPIYLAMLLLISCIVGILCGGNIEISQNVYANGMSDLAMSYGMGILFLNGLLKLNVLKGGFSEKIRWIGRNAMYLCCVHTVAYTVIPWERLSARLSNQKILGIVLECVLQLMLAILGCVLILKLQERKREKRNGTGNR